MSTLNDVLVKINAAIASGEIDPDIDISHDGKVVDVDFDYNIGDKSANITLTFPL